MPRNQQEVVEPEHLFDANSEPGQVIHIRGPLHNKDDGVVANGPEKRAGGAPHADAAAQVTCRAEASLCAG
eukprot:2425309-Lingulodinium_polyedra.AAC.1